MEIGGIHVSNFSTASCISYDSSKTICISINSNVFKEVLGGLIKKINYRRLLALREVSLFRDWSWSQLDSLLTHIFLKTATYDTCLFSEGEKNSNFFYLISGELEVTSNATQKSITTSSIIPFTRKYTSKKKIILMKIFKGGVIGEEDGILPSESKKKFTVRVVSEACSYFVIPKEVTRSSNLRKLQMGLVINLNCLE